MIVVDASALTDALAGDGPTGTSARAALATDPHWAAPSHLQVEVVSAVRGKVLRGGLSDTRAREVVRALAELVIDQVDVVPLMDRMWQLRRNLTAYDAAYVATAELLDCPLVTGDRRLARASGVQCDVTVISR